MPKRPLPALSKHEYQTLTELGMLYEFYPEATGNWNNDCKQSNELRANDFVDIPRWKGSADESARVLSVKGKYVWVTNINMPFCGSLCNHKMLKSQVKRR